MGLSQHFNEFWYREVEGRDIEKESSKKILSICINMSY